MIGQGRDQFKISYGNMRTLEMIPKMMEDDYYRKELRKLALAFLMKDVKGQKGEQQ